MNNNLPIFHSDDDETMMILTMMAIIVMMMKCSSILCQQIKLNVTQGIRKRRASSFYESE